MDCSLPGSSVHGISQAKVLEWGAIAFSDSDPIIKIANNIKYYCCTMDCSYTLNRMLITMFTKGLCHIYVSELGFDVSETWEKTDLVPLHVYLNLKFK